MSRLGVTVLVLLGAAVLGGCASGTGLSLSGAGRAVVGSGPAITQPRPVSGVSSVRLEVPGQVEISTGPTTSLTVEGQMEVLSVLTTDVTGTQLRLSTKDDVSFQTDHPIVYRLTVPSLDRIDVEGSGTVTYPDLSAPDIRVAINGSGRVGLGGTVSRQEVTISGSGRYAGDGLASKTATVRVSGSGQLELAVADTLDAEINGSGTVRYRGHPEIHQHVNGSGEVTSG